MTVIILRLILVDIKGLTKAMSSDKCYCNQLSAIKPTPLTAWDDFGANETNANRPKANTSAKGKKQWAVKSRYGYESLEDKYKFGHYEDIAKYIEEYRNLFSVCNRAHKKPWKPHGAPYNLIRVIPPSTQTPIR